MKSMQLAAASGTDPAPRALTNVNDNLNHAPAPNQTSERVSNENALQGVLPMDEKALSGLQARMERLKSGSIDPL